MPFDGLTPDELDALGISPPQPDLTPQQTYNPAFIENFAGAQGGPSRTFGEGVVSGIAGGLGAAGTRAQAHRQKLEAVAQQAAQARNQANLEASRDYRTSKRQALRDQSQNQRTDTRTTEAFNRDNPVATEEDAKAGLVPLRYVGHRVPMGWLKPPTSAGEPLVIVKTPQGDRYLPRSQAAGREPGGGAGAKPPTAVQQQAAAFYNRANDAVGKIETVGKAGSLEDRIVASGTLGQYGLKAPNVAQSSDMRLYNQAKRVFATAILRKESGAAINQGEYDSIDKAYFVQPGDDKATIVQKRAARKVAIDGMKLSAAPSSPDMPDQTPVNPASFWESD